MKNTKLLFKIKANTDGTITIGTPFGTWCMLGKQSTESIKDFIKDIYGIDDGDFECENLFKLIKKGYRIHMVENRKDVQLTIAYHHLAMTYDFEKCEDYAVLFSQAEKRAKNFNNPKQILDL